MAKACPSLAIRMSFYQNWGRVGGVVNWSEGQEPKYVEFVGVWPVIRIGLTTNRRRIFPSSTIQRRKGSWHAHVPRRRLGIPEQFRLDHAGSRRCVRREGDYFVFDFIGMAPLPSDDFERRAVVLL